MKQIVQYLSSGEIALIEAPIPKLKKGQVLIKSSKTLLSSGTEKFLIDFGKSNLFQKAIKQPERVKDVLDKTKTDGIINTVKSVQSKLDEPIPLGYCNVGTILEVGEGIKNLKVGQRVVSNGYHAEYVVVPENLCVVIPSNIDDSTAVFTILASIGLQGIRLINPTLGETILVSGLGIIGLLSAQLLKFNGCKVLGVDPDKKKCALAEELGINTFHLNKGSDPLQWCLNNTNHLGVDGVLITASTKSSEPIDFAAKVSRIRGRIVLVGVTGIEIKRDLFYKKELTFQVSCSYGPGRYDKNYEQLGHDYPIGYVRWTEKRNFEAVLHAFASGYVKTEKLISKNFPIDFSNEAYELLMKEKSILGIVLDFPNKNINLVKTNNLKENNNLLNLNNQKPVLSFIGSGNYAKRILIPSFSKAGAELNIISSEQGLSSVFLGNKFGFNKVTTDQEEIFNDKDTNSIVIATRHDSHAKYILKALENGKNVFVEKPLCINLDELNAINSFFSNKNLRRKPILMVGFNRRFSPLITYLKSYLDKTLSTKAYIYTCNAGFIDEAHWTQDPLVGGGRLLGEACHFIDLIMFLESSPIAEIRKTSIPDSKVSPDTFSLQLRFESGSIATVHYFSNGHKSYQKEKLEVFSEQKIFQMNNFRVLKAWGVKGFKSKRSFSQNKGQLLCAKSFLNAIKNSSDPPIPYSHIFQVQKKLLEVIN